ncbi:MAG: GGDEF domain-containing protein [Planctomycetia bacterium]|nr:GGDEF domain-containing protein [Planctomycetia bacterium]
MSLLIADLDHFKDFNDSYSHMAGNRALQQITTIMRNFIRISDVLTRYGGEEFVIVLPTADTTNTIMKSEEIRKSVEAIDFEDVVTGKPIKITLSMV